MIKTCLTEIRIELTRNPLPKPTTFREGYDRLHVGIHEKPHTLAILVSAAAAHAQTPTPSPNQSRLEFNVASIRPSGTAKPGLQAIDVHADGAGYTASYVPVKLMIAFMYRILARQIIGGPAW